MLLQYHINNHRIVVRRIVHLTVRLILIPVHLICIPGLRRIRFVSAHPRDFSQETIDMFAELPQLMPRLHLPLQSGSDSMLKKMGRGYDMERFLGVVEGLRKARPV